MKKKTEGITPELYNINRAPIKGFIITGGTQSIVSYAETEEECKEIFLRQIQEPVDGDRLRWSIGLKEFGGDFNTKYGFDAWATANPDAYNKFIEGVLPIVSVFAVNGAYLCSYYQSGMIVAKDIETLGTFISEWFRAKPDAAMIEKNREKPRAKASPTGLTPEDLEYLLRDAARGVAPSQSDLGRTQSQDQPDPEVHPSSSTA